jgi:predicted DCC family thiol-disulfide oxidoreductase YuxK
MDYWVVEMSSKVSYFQFGLGRYVVDYEWLALALRYGLIFITVIETLALFCLVSRPFRLIFLSVVIPFHVAVLLMMNILFAENMILISLVLIDWWRPPDEVGVRPILLFDGECNLCNSTVDFVIRHDIAGLFLFAASQSEAGRRLMAQREVSPRKVAESIYLIEGNRISSKSSAALGIARALPFPWCVVSALVIVPRPLRDRVYDLVSRNRYRWFGKRDTCRVPSAEERDRFLANFV